MKKLFVKDLAKKSLKDLVKLRNKLRRELFDNKLKNTMRALGQTHLITL
jgi:ribosomal protein L29